MPNMILAEIKKSGKDAGTAKSLIHSLGRSVRTLNLDTERMQSMPSILPGEKGVSNFVAVLTEHGFPLLANAFSSVHAGEKKIRKGKNFPSQKEKRAFQVNAAVINDMRTAVEENLTLLNRDPWFDDQTQNTVPFQTSVGEIALTFYESVLQALAEGTLTDKTTSQALQKRARILANQQGFTLSPLMEHARRVPIMVPMEDLESVRKRDEVDSPGRMHLRGHDNLWGHGRTTGPLPTGHSPKAHESDWDY